MSNKIWMGIVPDIEATRVIAISRGQTLLKARLHPAPSHPRALQWLLESVALWQGGKVRAVLCADDRDGTPDMSLFRDYFTDFGGPLYALQHGRDLREVIRRADRLGMHGDYSDLRQLHLADLLSEEGL